MIVYYLLRCLLSPFAWFPHWLTYAIGKGVGTLCYFCIASWRKRAFSNLSLARALTLTPKEMKKIARASFQNLAIALLELPLIARTKTLHRYVTCENPETAADLIAKKQGVIFFVGHQANWELLFLEGTCRMPGAAIGRPIDNPYIDCYIRALRERFGGTMLDPHRGLAKGLRILREGKFLGIVGDQGLPDGHAGHFLGAPCFTSPAPALLALKAGAPIIVATIRREKRHYYIHYSDPIWPINKTSDALMDEVLALFEASVKAYPGQWLWQHNRWKQETSATVYYRYRHDTVLTLLPDDDPSTAQEAQILKEIYPKAFLTLATIAELPLANSYRYKFLIDLTDTPRWQRHFKKRSALKILTKKELMTCHPTKSLKEALIHTLCRNATPFTKTLS